MQCPLLFVSSDAGAGEGVGAPAFCEGIKCQVGTHPRAYLCTITPRIGPQALESASSGPSAISEYDLAPVTLDGDPGARLRSRIFVGGEARWFEINNGRWWPLTRPSLSAGERLRPWETGPWPIPASTARQYQRRTLGRAGPADAAVSACHGRDRGRGLRSG